MNDKEFERLKKSIKQKMNELSYLQLIYIRETGVSYIPGGIETGRTRGDEERVDR